MNVIVLGASGYVGGELIRLLLSHIEVETIQAVSQQHARRPVASCHPNLRDLTDLRFVAPNDVVPCDVVFSALAPGELVARLTEVDQLAPVVIDLSPDFRLKDEDVFKRYYAQLPFPGRAVVSRFVTGSPEAHRTELRTADAVAVPGCTATAAILALRPLAEEGLLEEEVLVDARTGSSGSGAKTSAASHHPERSRAMRVFRPLAHRHEAEIAAETGYRVLMSATAVEAVRGVQVVVNASAKEDIDEAGLWTLYRSYYDREPFVRIVTQTRGVHRYPEPRLLLGTNFCDVGFAVDRTNGHVVLIAALDNLVKGSAGNAIQCLNVRMGYAERTALTFTGLHPL